MKKFLLGITTCLALGTTILVSCNKTGKEQNTPHPENLKKLSATYGAADLPSNNGGMLVFRDSKHFDSYMAFLDRAEATITPEDETKDVHTVLQDIENGLGFNSLRKVTHEAYEVQDAKGWPSIEAIPDEHFINSPEMRSVLNNQLEVQIGSEIVHYVNKDIRVNIDADNRSLLDQYRKLAPVATLNDVRFIDPLLTGSSIQFLDGHGFVIDFGKGTVPKPTGTDFVVPPAAIPPNKCDNPLLVEFSGLGLRNAQGYFSGYCIIQYGDGTQETKYTSNNFGMPMVPNFQHAYPSLGQYTITIKGYYSGGGLVETRSQTVNVVAGGCAINFKETTWQYGHISSTVAWGGKLVMQNMGSNTGRVVAYTKLVRQNSDGSWSGFKGKIFTRLGCHAKQVGNCANEVDYLQGEGYDNNKKDNKVHRTGQGPFAWETAFGQHTYIDGNGEHTIWTQLNSCP
ncbi:MAG: hypothetical protein WC756_03060 [Taibaiella sp.]|jgi:hypothetical protein